MSKGNHVFNNFDGTMYNAFENITNAFGHSAFLKTLNGSGGNMQEAEEIQKKYTHSYEFLRQIRTHLQVAIMHTIQDDEPVGVDDPNSRAYGELAEVFSNAVSVWVFETGDANPLDVWRQLVNIGRDKTAMRNYIEKGSSQKETPKSAEAREKQCDEIHKFIKGELSKLVLNWLLALRLDLKLTKAVSYQTKPKEWKEILERATTVMD